MIIKIQKKSVVRFLEHEFEATEGKSRSGYDGQQKLEDVYIFSVGYYRPLDNGDNVNGGFRDITWTEKAVPMTPEEDVHREHVLYART